MLSIINNNPYRILGVYSNSPKRELLANKGKMQAYLRINQNIAFPLDLPGVLPKIVRTPDMVVNADSKIALPKDKIKFAQFWFINATNTDSAAFDAIFAGQIEDGINLWERNVSATSLQNLFVYELIMGDCYHAITKYASSLYKYYASDLLEILDANVALSPDDLIHNIIDTLQEEGVNFSNIPKLKDNAWSDYISQKETKQFVEQLNVALTKAESVDKKDSLKRLSAGQKLMEEVKPLLEGYKKAVSDSDSRYQLIADKVANEVLNCAIDYYNANYENDVEAPIKSLDLYSYACSIAVGKSTKDRCYENKETIDRAIKVMPPKVVSIENTAIRDALEWYNAVEETSANGFQLLSKVREHLASIKEKLGKSNVYYLEISSRIANAVLSYVISEFNKVQEDDKPKKKQTIDGIYGIKYSIENQIVEYLNEQERKRQKAYRVKDVFISAWKTILYIDLLDVTEDFKNKRYNKNRDTIHSTINVLHGFSIPREGYIFDGCCKDIKADKRFFWSDSDYFNACKKKSDYKEYLNKFPNGKHIDEVKKRLDEIKRKTRKYLLYTFIGVTFIILVGLISLLVSKQRDKSSTQDSIPESEHTYSSPRYNNINKGYNYDNSAIINEIVEDEDQNYDDETDDEDDYLDNDDEDEYLDSDDDITEY